MGWVDGFRGLWGLDTRDRFAGERAPAGPEVHPERPRRASRGTTRSGSSGSTSCPPPGRMPAVLEERIAALQAERPRTARPTEAEAEDLRRLGAAAPAVRSRRSWR